MPRLRLTTQRRDPHLLDALQSVLAIFEHKTGIQVTVDYLVDWSEVVRVATSRLTPDVSEVGSTRVASLIAMDMLRPFTEQDVSALDLTRDFTPTSLQSCRRPPDTHYYALPFAGESYMILYRRDLLRAAGIDEDTAFISHQAIDQTAARLKETGVDVPVELPWKHNSYGFMHSAASWVWAAGGEYCTDDGRRVLLDQPQVQAALSAYLGLLSHLSPAGCKMVQESKRALFFEGKAAITFENLQWQSPSLPFPPQVTENLGAALLPTARMAGGSGLVVWKSSHGGGTDALRLVEFLASHEAQRSLIQVYPRLANLYSVLDLPEVQGDPLKRVMAESIRSGRAYPSGVLWTVIGDRFTGALAQTADEYLASPGADLADLVHRNLDLLNRKLNLALSSW